MRVILAAFAIAMLALAPASLAHAVPNPPAFMTRMLHDYNDDWGSDASGSSPSDGHDIIALDIREAYNASLAKDVLVLRLLLNFGYDGDSTKPELREVVTFKAKGDSVSREFRTSDNVRFSGDFETIVGPVPITKSDGTRDGNRFYVEGSILAASLGLKVGEKVSEFSVQGYGGTQAADHMVGGFTKDGQRTDEEPASEVAQPASYRRVEYALRGPVAYAKSTLDVDEVAARPGENKTLTWEITNTAGQPQSVTLGTMKPSGVTVVLHGATFTTETLTFPLAADEVATIHAYVVPQEGGRSGPMEFNVLTDLGGRIVQRVDLTIGDGANDSPGTPTVVVLACIVLVAAAVSRRGR